MREQVSWTSYLKIEIRRKYFLPFWVYELRILLMEISCESIPPLVFCTFLNMAHNTHSAGWKSNFIFIFLSLKLDGSQITLFKNIENLWSDSEARGS